MNWKGAYPPGTRVQHRNGYIFVKTSDGLIAEARHVWQTHKGELVAGDKIYHLDGDRTNNDISNLAKIHFNEKKFTFLDKGKILFMPGKGRKDLTNEILALAKNKLPRKPIKV